MKLRNGIIVGLLIICSLISILAVISIRFEGNNQYFINDYNLIEQKEIRFYLPN